MVTIVGGPASPAAAEVLLEARGGLTTVELLGPAPNVNKEPAGGKRVTYLSEPAQNTGAHTSHTLGGNRVKRPPKG